MGNRYWTVRGWHDWEPIYNRKAKWNWIDFTFLSLAVEWANYLSPHVWEVRLALFGLHVEFIRVDRAKAAALDAHVAQVRPLIVATAPADYDGEETRP